MSEELTMARESLILVGESEDGSGMFLKSFSARKSAKWIILALSVAVAALAIALVVVSLIHKERGDQLQICLTPECVTTSAYVINKMNLSVDPCDNMYSYACGGWLARKEVPNGYNQWNSDQEVGALVGKTLEQIFNKDGRLIKGRNSSAISKVKTYYHTCMDQEDVQIHGIKRLLQMISELGSWTLTTSNVSQWDSENWSLQTSLERMHSMGIDSLFVMKVVLDKETYEHILTFDGSGLTLDEEAYMNTTDIYVTMVTRIALLVNGGRKIASQKVNDLYNFETNLSKILATSKTNQKNHPIIPMNQLRQYFSPWLDIHRYLNQRYNGQALPTNMTVHILSPGYFKLLKELINASTKEVLANYMMWGFINNVTDYLPAEFNAIKVDVKYNEDVSRSEICLQKTCDHMGYAVGAMFVERNLKFHEKSKKKAIATVDEIKKEFISNLKTIPWLDDSSRNRLELKVKYLKHNIGYPDWIMDVDMLDEYYENLYIESGDFLDHFVNISTYMVFHDLSRLLKAPTVDEWLQYAIEVVPLFYDNTISVPAAYLQFPFYDPLLPESFYYANIAFIIGHEILHAFEHDVFSEGANGTGIFPTSAREGFQNGTNCLVDQYSKYMINVEEFDGNLTLHEDIADNGGLKLAFRAFKKAFQLSRFILPGLHFSDEQLFFLGFSQIWCTLYSPTPTEFKDPANVHTMDMYRVIGVLSNMADFAHAYGCQLNSFMNPEKKCQVW